MSYQKRYWDKVKHNREVDEAFYQGKMLSRTQANAKLTQAQARLEDAEKLLRPFANYHCNDDGCECHNCEAHRFISKPLSDNEGGE